MSINKDYELLKYLLKESAKREKRLQKEVLRLTKELQNEMNKKEEVYKQFIGEMKTLMLPTDNTTSEIIEAKIQKKSKFEKLKDKANKNSSKAQFSLGTIYSNGLNNFEVNKKEAVKWFKKSAKGGHDKAQYNLGVFFESGEFIKQDYIKALAWFEKAARQENAKAQYNLAVMYVNGTGIQKDLVKTKYWAKKAIENNFEKAQKLWDIFELENIKG